MEEFLDVVRAFGRATLKVLIGVAVGFGVALLTMGIRSAGAADTWQYDEPPLPETFLGIGAGLLASAAMLILLFYVPWLGRNSERPKRDQGDSPPEIR